MGNQQANNKSIISSQINLPQSGYRVTNLQSSINSQSFKLNIMTDYVIGQDPRLIDLQKLHQLNQYQVEFDVFSILDYRIRKVNILIQKHSLQFQKSTYNSINQEQITVDQQKTQSISYHSKKQFTLGINFKFYPKINDTILRISKIFKYSPLQIADIKKDQYIVGLIQGDFTSMKSFVDLIKMLIQSKFEYITLAVCDSEGITRLQKIPIKDLQNWKKTYGIGYLGIQLAQGWLNKWQLKKHIDANKRKQLNSTSIEIVQSTIQNKHENYLKSQSQQASSQQKTKMIRQQIVESKEEVDFFKQAHKIQHQDKKQDNINADVGSSNFSQFQQKNKQQITKTLVQTQDNAKPKPSQINRIAQNVNNDKKQEPKQISKMTNLQEIIDSNSEISSNQIEQKCNQMEQCSFESKKREMNVIKKSKNIIEINFKDDASTICMCKDYSKHCEKCFKQKQGNYYFFNKKTNKIILIEKSMLFPKKN